MIQSQNNYYRLVVRGNIFALLAQGRHGAPGAAGERGEAGENGNMGASGPVGAVGNPVSMTIIPKG